MVYKKTAEEALSELKTRESGLTAAEAEASRNEHGPNVIPQGRRKTVPEVFISQFADLLVLILIASAAISFATGNADSAIVILCVITLNAVLGTYQHFKAERSLESLKKLSAPSARVRRDGKVVEIPASEVVVGDILLLEAGNVAAADGRVTEAAELTSNESSLTGESTPVSKNTDKIDGDDIPLGDRTNMIYGGSMITNGRGVVAVSAVGADSEIGKIATLINKAKKRKTPLQISLDKLGKVLSFVTLAVCALVMTLSIIRGETIADSLTFAVALAVAAIPEALSSIVTVSLALGTQKMAKQNAIMKDLKAVEGLGGVSIICSDKTGTLTRNEMTVRDFYINGDITGEYTLGGTLSEVRLAQAMQLCNDGIFTADSCLGDPTETALLLYFGEDTVENSRSTHKRISELPFDSDRKAMSTLNVVDGGKIMFTKGAVDGLLPKITHIISKDGIVPISENDKDEILAAASGFSDKGMRVLCFACREFVGDKLAFADESGLAFIGLAAMTDPPREESKAAVADCLRAGIKPIMITGDHKATAVAIAKEIGIFAEGDTALDGTELEKISDDELCERIESISVYARVSPNHKIRIVEAWQSKGRIVAMTGDGVNDAPALKKADIGVAMGITGTEVSKDAAGMILADDNFATIVRAVSNGRSIFRNIRSSVSYLISGNIGGIITVLFASLLGLPVPFSAVQLLFINLATDSLPAIAIGTEPPAYDVLNDKPRSPSEGILNKRSFGAIAFHGAMLAAVSIAAFLIGLNFCPESAGTMAFLTLCLGRLFEVFSFRSEAPLCKVGLMSNRFSVLAFAAGAVLLSLTLFVPVLQPLFDVVPPEPAYLGISAGLAFMPAFIAQLVKMFRKN